MTVAWSGPSVLIVAKNKNLSVPCELVVKKGAGHGWKGLEDEIDRIADWFDRYVRK
jgi:hypothetical protein